MLQELSVPTESSISPDSYDYQRQDLDHLLDQFIVNPQFIDLEGTGFCSEASVAGSLLKIEMLGLIEGQPTDEVLKDLREKWRLANYRKKTPLLTRLRDNFWREIPLLAKQAKRVWLG